MYSPGVVAISDYTMVSFALPPASNVTVKFLDRVYKSGEILTVVLDIYGTFQLQTLTAADLTGCRVYADKPIAVYSGNKVAQVSVGHLDSAAVRGRQICDTEMSSCMLMRVESLLEFPSPPSPSSSTPPQC